METVSAGSTSTGREDVGRRRATRAASVIRIDQIYADVDAKLDLSDGPSTRTPPGWLR
jgi:hypothetical protein